MNTLKGPLLAKDGARFELLVQDLLYEHSDHHFRASYKVELDQGDSTFVENDIRMFISHDAAIAWGESEARRRGFETIQLVKERLRG